MFQSKPCSKVSRQRVFQLPLLLEKVPSEWKNLFLPGISWRLRRTGIIQRRKYTVLTYPAVCVCVCLYICICIYIYIYIYTHIYVCVYALLKLHILLMFIDTRLNFFTLPSKDFIKFCDIDTGLNAPCRGTTQNRNLYTVLDVMFYHLSDKRV